MISAALLIAALLAVWYIAAGLFVYAGYPIALNRQLSLRQVVYWPIWAAVALILILQVYHVQTDGIEP